MSGALVPAAKDGGHRVERESEPLAGPEHAGERLTGLIGQHGTEILEELGVTEE